LSKTKQAAGARWVVIKNIYYEGKLRAKKRNPIKSSKRNKEKDMDTAKK
jgi:hypothetical protein